MCFGFGASRRNRGDDQEIKKNADIDKMIKRNRKEMDREVKILLLGAGESGKSTILKQMRIIHSGGFSTDERREVRAVIYSNIVVAFKVILDIMNDDNITFSLPESEKWSNQILSAEHDVGPDEAFPPEMLPAMKGLWLDKGVKQAVSRGHEFALHDNLSYFFSSIDRIWEPGFIPSDQDVLQSRLRTTGITETIFDLGQLTYRMVDVGGQRSERKKWIHCFEGCNCLLFLVALSGYDQCLVEDQTANQMHEAMMLFESLANGEWFKRKPIILFLNKIDLFKDKLPKSPLANYFPDYSGDPTDFDAASRYFAERFRAMNRQQDREIYIHYTNATDTTLLKVTMQSVQDMILQRNLNNMIL
ncbi:MAG: hypothetical protein M1834_005527 [Cirrosporium novae-zelandiae]|nr:MAG: hypothetical protein M1834_005527 [Cirrosporium novae-zelandiae]